jgi:pimeloyl-ACP methyl ester carboxylesterase
MTRGACHPGRPPFIAVRSGRVSAAVHWIIGSESGPSFLGRLRSGAMATYGLVHGVCAGAWCWDLVVPHLEAAGHRVVAIDLPGDQEDATFSDYADVVERALGDTEEDIVLVGHSTGGLTIPLVAARRRVRELVFVCGVIPVPGESAAERGIDWRVIEPVEWQLDNGDGSFSISPEGFRRHVAHGADPTVVAEAIPRLRRQFVRPFLLPCPLDAMPDVARRYILCTDDHIVGPAWSRREAPARLGVDPIELSGSHAPMASRPSELANLLLA